MSFNLGIWYSRSAVSQKEAQEQYITLCECDSLSYAIEPSPQIARFVRELCAKHPQPSDCTDGDADCCPWTADFDISDGHVILSVAGARRQEIAAWVREAASRYGLVCYDPQSEELHLPEFFDD